MATPMLAILLLCTTYQVLANPIDIVEAIDEVTPRDDDDPYRLPTTIRPESYTINLQLGENFGPDGIFQGSVIINFRTYANVEQITLHAQYLDIDPTRVTITCGSDETTNLFSSLSNSTTYHTITLNITSAIANNTACVLSVNNYGGLLTDDMAGFYRSSYTNEAGETE